MSVEPVLEYLEELRRTVSKYDSFLDCLIRRINVVFAYDSKLNLRTFENAVNTSSREGIADAIVKRGLHEELLSSVFREYLRLMYDDEDINQEGDNIFNYLMNKAVFDKNIRGNVPQCEESYLLALEHLEEESPETLEQIAEKHRRSLIEQISSLQIRLPDLSSAYEYLKVILSVPSSLTINAWRKVLASDKAGKVYNFLSFGIPFSKKELDVLITYFNKELES